MVPIKRPLAFTLSAPGKVILHGEHSVVYGKTALAASLNLRTNITLKEIDSTHGNIDIDLPNLDLKHVYTILELNNTFLSEPPPLLKGSRSDFNLDTPELIDSTTFIKTLREYVLKNEKLPKLTFPQECALIAFLFLYTGIFCSVNIQIQPMSIEAISDLAIASGAGSSASFAVCLSAALIHYIRSKISFNGITSKNISKNGYKTMDIKVTDLTVFSPKEKELISRWALTSEKIMHGNPSGIDNAVCTFGSIIKFKKGDVGRGQTIEHLPNAAKLKILLVDSGVSRNTAGMLARVSDRLEAFPLVVKPTLDAMDGVAVAAAGILSQMGKMDATIGDALEQQHILHSKLELLTQFNKTLALQELVDMNQALLNTLGVSHPSLDRICRTVSKHGLHAKLTGAGGGGYAFILFPSRASEHKKLQQVKEELQRKGFICTETELGGVGITVSNLV
ncbi:Mevalonate kinase [Blattella germanica]|nr:Mevalonate kinase [Blattella germanica]